MLKLSTASCEPVRSASDSPRRFSTDELPADWPAPGPIDLAVQDLPHASADLEWWYVNVRGETVTGKRVGVFAAFFRQAWSEESRYVHSTAWALADEDKRKYHSSCAADRWAPAWGLSRLAKGGGVEDDSINRAMREVLSRNRLPGPTRMFRRDPTVASERLSLDYDGDRFLKRTSGAYELHLHDPEQRTGCDLLFSPRKPPIRHGNEGVLHGVAEELMFYYFIPRCSVTGSVMLDGERLQLRQASGWYDHEFGFVPQRVPGDPPASWFERRGEPSLWTWASLQLDNDVDVTVYSIVRPESGIVLDHWVIVSDADGQRAQYRRASLTPIAFWRSQRTFVEYPIAFALEVPEAGLSLRLTAVFPEQEVITVMSDPAFWEGQVQATGSWGDRCVSGCGWVERKGFRFHRLDDFLRSAGEVVRAEVAKVLPREPSTQRACSLLLRNRSLQGLEAVDGGALGQVLFEPIREMVERGGKAWRSYAALGCIDVVGGDTSKFLHWLAVPEILHVGSLIVDDVEDQSTIRRGAPCCHRAYGEPLAINAGTAAYFMAEPPLEGSDLPAETKVRIYRLYFDVMRAGHAGQALDLAGLDGALTEAVESGEVKLLEGRVLAIHCLKTAIPAGLAARMGAILGGGTEVQIEALGAYFEAVGLAFQIIDDVLNLRGFRNNLKERGEDLQSGKVTLPFVKGIACADSAERARMVSLLRSRPDPQTAAAMIARLEEMGALTACDVQAREIVEAAWARLDPVIADSQQKVLFRAFGWYVLERHY